LIAYFLIVYSIVLLIIINLFLYTELKQSIKLEFYRRLLYSTLLRLLRLPSLIILTRFLILLFASLLLLFYYFCYNLIALIIRLYNIANYMSIRLILIIVLIVEEVN